MKSQILLVIAAVTIYAIMMVVSMKLSAFCRTGDWNVDFDDEEAVTYDGVMWPLSFPIYLIQFFMKIISN